MAVTSLISAKTKPKFLFLLDCSIEVSGENEKELIESLAGAKSRMKGLGICMLLRTLNSYHVVGFVPLSSDEWHEHMVQAILLKNSKGQPFADIRYIGHSLERGYGSLRISDYLGKPTPDFICYL